jgi:hypothetical protein
MNVMGMVLVLLAQAAPLPGATAQGDAERQIEVPVVSLPARVEVNSTMGKRFKLVEARVVIDGQELGRRVASGGQELEPQFRVFDGEVGPGPHQVTVSLVYEGRNVGIFTYMDDYKVRMQSSAEFTVQDRAHPAVVQVLAYERSGVTIPIEKRPTMELKPGVGAPTSVSANGPSAR